MSRRYRLFSISLAIVALPIGSVLAGPAVASDSESPSLAAAQPVSFSLRDVSPAGGVLASALGQPAEETTVESTTVTTYEEGDKWDLSGPYFLRSADPEEPGEMDLKIIYGYETASGEDDDHELEFVLEWGMARNWEFILEAPFEIGDGGVEGNGDITAFGFHTRFWEEDGWIPAVAMRNLMRIPTGYHSSGVDYIGRLLVTKSILPGRLRAHFNPFLTSVNGNNEEEARHFQWGAAIGVDYRVNDDLVLVADYLHRTSEEEGYRNNHSIELGADWKLAEHHTVAFGTELGLDGDSSGANWGFKVSYILSLAAPRLDRE